MNKVKVKVSKEDMLNVLKDMLDVGKSPDVFLLEGEVVEEKHCCCNEPWIEGVIHRKDLPCYYPERKSLPPLPEELAPVQEGEGIDAILRFPNNQEIVTNQNAIIRYFRVRDGQK